MKVEVGDNAFHSHTGNCFDFILFSKVPGHLGEYCISSLSCLIFLILHTLVLALLLFRCGRSLQDVAYNVGSSMSINQDVVTDSMHFTGCVTRSSSVCCETICMLKDILLFNSLLS